MKNNFIKSLQAKKYLLAGILLLAAQIGSFETAAQTKRKKPVKKTAVVNKTKINKAAPQDIALPKVTQIDAAALRTLVKRVGTNPKPLLVNFWATWCPPCLDEFPELVKIDSDYKNKIDFIVISLDDLAEIERDVPKFLINMKAGMPAYLLKAQDEQAAIASVSKNYQGALPFTVLFNEKGAIVYTRQGKVAPEILRAAIEKLLPNQAVK